MQRKRLLNNYCFAPFVKENQQRCTSRRDLIQEALLRDRKRRKKAEHLTGIKPMTSRVLLSRPLLYHCATTAAHRNSKDESKPNFA